MARGKQPARASDFRVWLLRCGANPAVIPELLSCAALSSMPDWGLGDTERSECPDPSSYAGFVVYDEIPGAVDNAKLGIKMKYARDLAPLLAFARTRQIADIQLLMGRCNSPEEYTKFDKILVLTYAKPTKWAADKITAMQSGDNGSSEEMIDLSGVEYYEIVPLDFSPSLAAELVEREIVGIDICNSPNCDDVPCPTPCQTVVAVQLPDDDPTAVPSVILSNDGGATWSSENITTMADDETPSDIRCTGDYVVVLNNTGNAYEYTTLESLLAGAPVWAEMATGFVATKLPNESKYISGTLYIAGDGGYIYRVRGIGSAAVVLEAGSATVQNLVDIDAVDTSHIVAVGASNAVVATDDGVNFELIVGPSVGTALTAICMLDANTWLVATATALYSTLNRGATWQTEGLPVAMTNITDIQHVGGVVYLSGVSGGSGVILRNTAGGTDALGAWYVLPEGAGSIPTNQKINKLAVCHDNYNLVYGAGLGAVTDGIIVRASP